MHQDSLTTTFASLNLAPQLLRALVEKGYTHPSPIQAKAIPPLLEGRDYIGCAQTGTERPPRSPCRSSTGWPQSRSFPVHAARAR